DLPDAFHRMQGGDFRGDEHVALLDGTVADRAGGRRPEEHGAGRDRASLHVRFPTDVDDLRHRLRMAGRASSPSRLCQGSVAVDPAPRDASPTDDALCQIETSDARSIMYAAREIGRAHV